MAKIIRVFPTKTNATPEDDLVRVRALPTLLDEADEIHISVTFTWDIQWAEEAAKMWLGIAPVQIGGPAYNEPGGDFVPGFYLKHGYVITSRGCPNRCWFCSVPKREGGVVRELPVTDGWIIQDDNLLACSQSHIDKVFEMLSRQPVKPMFTGGLEAKLLTKDIAIKLKAIKPKTIFFAYDTPDDLPPLIAAGRKLIDAGFKKSNHILKCFVLCGYKGDTFEKAQKRMGEVWRAGFVPMAMLYRDQQGLYTKEWRRFQRQWANHIIAVCNCKHYFGE